MTEDTMIAVATILHRLTVVTRHVSALGQP